MKLGESSAVAYFAIFSFSTGFLSASADLQNGVAYSETGTKNHLRALSTNETKKPKKTKGKKSTKKGKQTSDRYDSCHVCNRSVPQSSIITVDYLIVGAGPAGLSTAADLSKALKSIDSSKTIAVIEKEPSHGGRIRSVDLVEPVGYEGPPLRTDVGASRMQTSTLVNTRRLYNEYGVDAYCSIFNNRQVSRGRSKYCDMHNECNIFGSFCVDAPIFVDETQTAEKPFGSAFAGIPESSSAESDAMGYLYGYGTTNPVTGLDCDNSSLDQKYQCPEEACKVATDYNAFLVNHLSPEYSELLKHANVGFFGDFSSSINACRHREWLTREYDTLSYNCYAIGGMQTLPDRMVERCLANGNVDFYFDQPAMCIDSFVGNENHQYEVVTPDYTFKVQEFLFLATSNTEFTDGKIEGDVIEDIARAPEAKSSKPIEVASVMMQWDPDSPAWFMDLLDKAGGTYSLRAYGDLDCFARVEIIDTPYHRQQNVMKVVYSDHQCKEMWKNLIEDAEQTGDTDKLRDRAMEGLANLFPDHEIPQPVKTVGAFWSNGWHFTEPASTVENDAVISFAANPFEDNDKYSNICLLGEAWQPQYGAWMESALLSSIKCFEHNFEGILGDELDKIFADREKIVNDHYDNDPNFSAYPGETIPGQAFPILSNEYFPPFDCLYNSDDGTLLKPLANGDTCVGPICSSQGVPS